MISNHWAMPEFRQEVRKILRRCVMKKRATSERKIKIQYNRKQSKKKVLGRLIQLKQTHEACVGKENVGCKTTSAALSTQVESPPRPLQAPADVAASSSLVSVT